MDKRSPHHAYDDNQIFHFTFRLTLASHTHPFTARFYLIWRSIYRNCLFIMLKVYSFTAASKSPQ
jgi:hypothetical protein